MKYKVKFSVMVDASCPISAAAKAGRLVGQHCTEAPSENVAIKVAEVMMAHVPAEKAKRVDIWEYYSHGKSKLLGEG